MKLRSY